MASTAPSEIRELGDSHESRRSHLERVADDNRPHQPDAHHPNGQVERDVERSAPWFLVYAPLIQVEGGILQLHCQEKSPFDTHPVKMWIFTIATFIHYGAALYYARSKLTGSRYSKICDPVGYISGSLASAAFLSILVPPSLVPLVFVVWMLHLLLYVDGVHNKVLNVVQKLYRYFSNDAVPYLYNIWNHISGSNN